MNGNQKAMQSVFDGLSKARVMSSRCGPHGGPASAAASGVNRDASRSSRGNDPQEDGFVTQEVENYMALVQG